MYKIFPFSLFFFLFFISSTSFASQVRIPDSYFFASPDCTIEIPCGPFVVYDNLTGAFIGGGAGYYEGYELNADFFGYLSSEYKIVEMSSQDVCQNSFLNYTDCISSPYFIQIVDTINLYLPLSDGGGGGGGGDPILDEELAPVAGSHSVTSYPPEVNIFSILKGSLFGNDLNIDYRVTDGNDNGNEKSRLGLSDNPVSIFYSDKITNWYDNFFGSDNKINIAKDQPKEGKYKWSVKDLIPGVLYKIIVEAVDLSGMWGQGVSEYFSVDFTEPVFTVKVDPVAVKSGEVSITVDSSEDLSGAPTVKVTQNEGKIKEVLMKGDKSHFKGTYEVISGFDGTAKIEVKGVDLAGNVGSVLVSGGTFSVGVNPPPKPQINDYKAKLVTTEGFVDISGSTRSDTEVVLSLNGIVVSKLKPDEKGSFSFNKIELDKNKNKGVNYLNIYSIDPLGSMSEGVLIEVKYNIPPTVKILKPATKDTLSNISSISVSGQDGNDDTLFYKYQIISQPDFNNKRDNWITLSEDDSSSSFSWNTTEVEDGSYVVRVVVTDGSVEITSDIVSISVKNILPYFRFENGRNTTTNQSNVFVKGKALTSVNVNPRPSITSVAYSMDNGNTWSPVKIVDDEGSHEKKFSVEFTNLKEGTYPVLWRTKDSRGFIGKLVHFIVVDKTSPKAPIITIPKLISSGITINDSNDENLNKTGVQVNISGYTEPLSVVNLSYKDKIITTKSLPTGLFTFSNVTFEDKGKYDFNIFAVDKASNKGATTSFFIVYNNLPSITFLNPKSFRGLPSKANVSWSIKDIDGDILNNVTVSYRNKNTDTLYKNLVTNGNPIGNYNWDTSKLVESNNYELKISVNDSYSTTSQIITFSIDRVAPSLTSFLFNKNEINKENKELNFVCFGSATDNLSGVEFVEYRVEDISGKLNPWYKAIITDGLLKNKANFSIKHPTLGLDGDYKVFARAVDASGNVSDPVSLSLFVDKNSPRVGGFFIEKNGVDMLPDENGKISIYKNSIFTFNISLEEDTESATLVIGNKTFELKKDIKSHLWKNDISLDGQSKDKLYISATDSSGNTTKLKEIGSLDSVLRGVVSMENDNGKRNLVVGANIQIFKLNKITNQYEDYINNDNNVNYIVSNQSGEYDLVLPEGSYKFIIKEPNIKTLKYKYELNRSSVVNIDFNVLPISSFEKLINNFLEIFK